MTCVYETEHLEVVDKNYIVIIIKVQAKLIIQLTKPIFR